jgi:RNA polymerase sigma factor (sigma-70 family)
LELMNDSRKLLEDYARRGSEAAFRELVDRYVSLVHSTALRLVNGDTHLAEDITQTVFLNLARKAGTLSGEVMIGGWLHRNACFVASTMMRGERRRQNRERQVVAMNTMEDHSAANLDKVAPLLDQAINQLEPEDRAAILLRYFEQMEFRAVGEMMGTNEDAARMRVNRALDKLHALLTQRGVALSAAALGTALAAEAVKAAPIGMAASVAAVALGGAVKGGSILTFLKLMSMTKIKIAFVSAIAVAAVAVPVVMQHQSLAKLSEENQALQQQAALLAPLQSENQRLSNMVVQADTSKAASEQQVRELARLRNEVGLLRQQTNDMAKLQERISQFSRGQSGFNSGKRRFPNMTMAEFAKFIAGVLDAPVADQTGLTGSYDIAMTPPRLGGEDGKLERVTGLLRDELGLQLVPFAGPFTAEEQQAVAGQVMQVLPDGTLTNVTAVMQSSVPNGANGFAVNVTSVIQRPVPDGANGFAIKLDHSDAPGLKPATGEWEPAQRMQALSYDAVSNRLGFTPAVVNNLRLIDASKQQWALQYRKQGTETPTWEDLRAYLGRGPNGDISAFTNASEGEYIIGSVGSKPQFRGNPNAPVVVTSADAQAPAKATTANACINNLRLIDSSKQQWALEYRKQSTDTPTMEEIRQYMGRWRGGEIPVCPDGGVYTLRTVGEKPTCSVAGHVLP